MDKMDNAALLRSYAEKYNDTKYFALDPVIFPTKFYRDFLEHKATLQDVEIAGLLAAHLAWGRRDMIVRDCNRAFEEMQWQPYNYVIKGHYRDDDSSLHRTIKWSEFAQICTQLSHFYLHHPSLELLTPDEMRTTIFSQKSDANAANKKIHLFRRWMVRNDGIVDLGIWQNTDPADLIIPLDVHVHRTALSLGITKRKSTDYSTAIEITEYLRKVFPDDPTLGDFALFAVAANRNND